MVDDEVLLSADTSITPYTPASAEVFDPEYSEQSNSSEIPEAGERVEVLWPFDQTFFPGHVDSVTNNGSHNIVYEEG